MLALALALPVLATPAAAAELFPQVPAAAPGTECLAPPGEMRRTHMDRLTHRRTEAVRAGIRQPAESLTRCLSCHAVTDTHGQVVTAEDPRHFCRECHDFAAVTVDCFSCHASRPEDAPR
ncbi:Hdr-like menaquinol oxidoreductase cytochrome c subunit [Roseospirillum parvum]|uniref:Hdr-like menaquinol oxidoreductase cytochrome c subunit n=1 Tax=Roseospirillum parvum TaxID=83401 RepID=UPI0011608BF6|nr:Hdr-like menaquinol oxidoreductase cytochrome c subunit [Roseospirillum parvum]